ncbi:polynucleotide adenylyltransferase PcnB [Desulfogranum japonicum]|uniref:polynucleotide adenylyltransferase PcnB n=1 Tax=Desulfogranum japonicum TaxID=231447 RepID=UPI00048E5F83|nr:polynucleotide adenylyltransferase PcnB [Desulfogranum japonicum]
MELADSGDTLGVNNQGVEAVVIPPGKHPIEEKLLDREALKVLYRLRDAGFKGYLVGGGVRDLYLGKVPKDFDISTDARPGQLRKLFRNSRTIGRRFRLVQVFFRGNKIIEISTLRSQSEHDLDGPDAILPQNNTYGTLVEDAFRRDLTINSLFYEVENHTIIDYAGGVADLENRIVRMVGDPDRRFTRDPVRILRAIRHSARTGFVIEKDTFAAISRHHGKLKLCPSSRLRDEVLKDLQSGASQPWVELCLQTPVWNTLFPMYRAYLKDGKHTQCKSNLFAFMHSLDQVYQYEAQGQKVAVPTHMLFATLLLAWAIPHFSLLEAQHKGRSYQRFASRIRNELNDYLCEQFNIKRGIKEGIASLLINFPALYKAHQDGNVPKWLKRKSYYRDGSCFFALYRNAVEGTEIPFSWFTVQENNKPATLHMPDIDQDEKSPNGRRKWNPAFSSKRKGVFGLRQQ